MADAETLTNKERRKARKAARSEPVAGAEDTPPVKRTATEEAVASDAEEEALSHKERRKRRKMEKAGHVFAPTDDDPPANPRAQRSAHSIWVGNLAFSTTSEQLTQWFRDQGIDGISRVHMPPGVRKFEYNKGFAYVDLPSAADVEACMALSEGSLAGRRLLIKNGNDYTGRPGLDLAALANAPTTTNGRTGLTKTAQKVLHAQKNPAAPTLFMGNLSFETTEDAIRELFDSSAQRRYLQEHEDDESDDELEPPGAGIKKIRMGTFEDSGKCKGFAFIDFESVALATQALIEPRNGRLLGRQLQLEYAGVDAVRRGASRNLLPDYVPTPRRRRRPTETDGENAPVASAAAPAAAPADADGEAKWPERTRALTAQRDAAPPSDKPWHNQSSTPREARPARAPKHTDRVRPGAANVDAARQSYTIVPSQGKRTTFS